MTDKTDLVTREESLPQQTRDLPVGHPLVDIYENDHEILLYADLPGVDKEAISINLDNGRLRLSGRRCHEAVGAVQWEEFGALDYQRTFSVPQTIAIDQVNAEMKDGVLCLHLPKSEAARPRRIEITS
ncbi:MAG: Hsp20/alpha crystallin family protein [Desulfofustis sp.]|nr:Hsp20/alpha crystallin family protein [Desulfofustis sp.]